MSEYVMLPGARLEIGPHGQPLETLGSAQVVGGCFPVPKRTAPCCASCADGGACEGVGDVSAGGVATIAVLGVAAAFGLAVLFPRAWRRFSEDLWGK